MILMLCQYSNLTGSLPANSSTPRARAHTHAHQERHESTVDELKESAQKAADEFNKLLSECNRKLERLERQSSQV